MQRKRVRSVFLGLLAVSMGAAVAWGVLVPALWSWQVERAITRFETSPSQADANELTELLGRGVPSRQQGERILKALLYPKVITRASYPLGIRPFVSTEARFEVSGLHAYATEEVGMWIDGIHMLGGSRRGGGPSFDFERGPLLCYFEYEPPEPRLYQGEIRYEYTLALAMEKTSWSWNPRKGRLPWRLLPRRQVTVSRSHPIPDYTWRFRVPVEVKVVTRDEAEKVSLLSNAELDERMRSAFTAGLRKMSCTFRTGAGERSCTGVLEIQYAALPAAIAFTPTLRLANGTRPDLLERYPGRYRAKANASGTFRISPSDFHLERTGEYAATLILTPDPNDAYEDPAIKAIWNRTLEFPIRFTVGP